MIAEQNRPAAETRTQQQLLQGRHSRLIEDHRITDIPVPQPLFHLTVPLQAEMGSRKNGTAAEFLPQQTETDQIRRTAAPLRFHNIRRDIQFSPSAPKHGQILETAADVVHRRIGWRGNQNFEAAEAECPEHLFQNKRLSGSRRSLNQNQRIFGPDRSPPCKTLGWSQLFRFLLLRFGRNCKRGFLQAEQIRHCARIILFFRPEHL